MSGHLNPIGENGSLSTAALIDALDTQLQRLSPPDLLSPQTTDQLLPDMVRILACLGQPAHAQQIVDAGPRMLRPLLLARLAEGRAPAEPAAARQILAQLGTPRTSSRLLAGIARVWVCLGELAEADLWFARALDLAREDAALLELLLRDHLDVGDVVGALGVLQEPAAVPAHMPRALLVRLLPQLHARGQLAAGLEVLHAVGDVLDRYLLIREVLPTPLAARDEGGCLLLLRAAPRVYWEDLLRILVPGFLKERMLPAASRAAALWREVDAVGIASLGARALVGEPEEARAALSAILAERLEVDDVVFSDAWVYRELGRACGWAGHMAGALAALERVADHEERLHALLDAVLYAPPGINEALLCAARGLVAGIEGDLSRATAAARLGTALARMGRRDAARTVFADAVQAASAIRRPRSDLGATRRAALEVLVRAQVVVDEHPGAWQALRRLRTRSHRDPLVLPSALAYARAGDLAGARCCLSLMGDGLAQLAATVAVLEAWLDAGRPACAPQESAA